MSQFSRIARQVGRVFPFRGLQVEPEERSDWIQLVQPYLGSSLHERPVFGGVSGGAGSPNGALLGPVPQDELWLLTSLGFTCDDLVARTFSIQDRPASGVIFATIADRSLTPVSATFQYALWNPPGRYVLAPGHSLYFVMDAITALKTFTGYWSYVVLKVGETVEP